MTGASRLNSKKLNLKERCTAFMMMLQATDDESFLNYYRMLTCDSSRAIKHFNSWKEIK